MLTTLAHQSSWPNLKGLIEDVLGGLNRDLDPSAVLDFLETCVYLQKQWQCRDKHVPKHDNFPIGKYFAFQSPFACGGRLIAGYIIHHIDLEAGFQSSKSTIAETGMGVTSRP